MGRFAHLLINFFAPSVRSCKAAGFSPNGSYPMTVPFLHTSFTIIPSLPLPIHSRSSAQTTLIRSNLLSFLSSFIALRFLIFLSPPQYPLSEPRLNPAFVCLVFLMCSLVFLYVLIDNAGPDILV